MSKKAVAFDIDRSQVSVDTLKKFVSEPIKEDLKSVPGIGERAEELIKEARPGVEDGIMNTYQLMGKFLLLKKDDQTMQEHCDAMWKWLEVKGVKSHRSSIVCAIAEKFLVMMPELSPKVATKDNA